MVHIIVYLKPNSLFFVILHLANPMSFIYVIHIIIFGTESIMKLLLLLLYAAKTMLDYFGFVDSMIYRDSI